MYGLYFLSVKNSWVTALISNKELFHKNLSGNFSLMSEMVLKTTCHFKLNKLKMTSLEKGYCTSNLNDWFSPTFTK